MFARIKADLPNLPDQVIATWLVPLAESGLGWPPDPADTAGWRYILLRQGLEYWRKCAFKPDESPLEIRDITPYSRQSIYGLIETNILGRTNLFSSLQDTQYRFNHVWQFILEHGELPVPPILMQRNDGLETIDGNHRLAALAYVRRTWASDTARKTIEQKGGRAPITNHKVWIANPPQEGRYETGTNGRTLNQSANDCAEVSKPRLIRIPAARNK